MDSLKKYISESIKAGFTSEQIKSKLRSSGYPEKVIDSSFRGKSGNRSFVILALGLVLVVLAFVFINFLKLPIEEAAINQEFVIEDDMKPFWVDNDRFYIFNENCHSFEIDQTMCFRDYYGVDFNNFEYCGIYIDEKVFPEMNPDIDLSGKLIKKIDGQEMLTFKQVKSYLKDKSDQDILIFSTENESYNVTLYIRPGADYLVYGFTYDTLFCRKT